MPILRSLLSTMKSVATCVDTRVPVKFEEEHTSGRGAASLSCDLNPSRPTRPNSRSQRAAAPTEAAAIVALRRPTAFQKRSSANTRTQRIQSVGRIRPLLLEETTGVNSRLRMPGIGVTPTRK